jgi:hypothetical protein
MPYELVSPSRMVEAIDTSAVAYLGLHWVLPGPGLLVSCGGLLACVRLPEGLRAPAWWPSGSPCSDGLRELSRPPAPDAADGAPASSCATALLAVIRFDSTEESL